MLDFKKIDIKSILSSRENARPVIMLGVGFIVIVIDLAFVFFPLARTAFSAQNKVAVLKKNIASTSSNISKMYSTRKKLEDLKVQQAGFEKKFPREDEISSLLNSLSSVAAKSGVDIIAIKPVRVGKITETKKGKEPEKESFHEIALEISAKGSYHQIGAFINKIEMMDRFMNIRNIDIASNNTSPRSHDLKLTVVTYILTN